MQFYVYLKNIYIKAWPAGLATVLLLALCSCEMSGEVNGKVKDGVNGNNNTSNYSSNNWGFVSSTDYTFNPNYLDFSAGNVALKTVNTTFNSGATFATGTFSGTTFTSGALSLTAVSGAELNKAWVPQPSKLLGVWRFNNDTRDDISGLTATSTNVGYSTSTQLGSAALDLSGANKYVDLSTSHFNRAKGTISHWVKANVNNARQVIFYASDGTTANHNGFMDVNTLLEVHTGIETTGKFNFSYQDGGSGQGSSLNSTTTAVNGTWYHLVVTYDTAGSIRIYVNGVLENSVVISGLTFQGISPTFVELGRLGSSTTTRTFDGYVDDLATWSEPLTATEVAALYRAQQSQFNNSLRADWTPKYSNLVGYWKMDNSWQDSSPSSLTAPTAVGMSYSTSAKVGSHAGVFDGTSGQLQLASQTPLQFANEGSICLWIYPNDITTDYQGLVERRTLNNNSSMVLNLRQDHIEFANHNGTSWTNLLNTGAATITTNGWQHVCATFKANATMHIYLDGVLNVSKATTGTLANPNNDWRIGFGYAMNRYYTGRMDDLAIWNAQLTGSDVALIYNRQKQKFSGSFDSPIIDLGASGPWTSLTSSASLPFSKELTGASGNESSAVYPSLVNSADATGSGNSLSSNLLGLWHMNEASGTSLADSSGNGNTATLSNAAALSSQGMFGRGLQLKRASSHYVATPSLNLGNNFTLSAWVKVNDLTTQFHTIFGNSGSSTSDGFRFAVNSWNANNGRVIFETGNGTLSSFSQTNAGLALPGGWHHILAAVDRSAGTVQIFVDGKLAVSGTTRTDFKVNGVINFGRMTTSDAYADAKLDEVAIWGRTLSANEALQVYRRGANRVAYQVKSCGEATCSCKTILTGGSTSDCSNDGTANDLAGTDANQAIWIGSDGTASSFFSELHNNTAVNSSGIPTGSVQTTGLGLDWSGSFFTSAARPGSNRYFQYRVYAESDDEATACGGATCSPQITSIVVSPTGRYYGGAPTIVNNTPLSFAKLQSLAKSESSACTKYQLSTDGGANWQYWNGSAWASTVNGLVDSNYFSDFSDKLSSLPAGQFKFKAFLTTNTSGDFLNSCTLNSVTASFQP